MRFRMKILLKICFLFVLCFHTAFYKAVAQEKKWTSQEARAKVGAHFYTNSDSAAYFLHYLIDLKDADTIAAKHYNNLGLLYSRNYQDSAIIYYKKSIALGTVKNRLSTMVNLAIVYKKARNFKEALAFLKETLTEYEKLNDQKGIATTYGVMGSLYTTMEEPTNAIAYLKKALAISKHVGSAKDYAIQQQNLASIYFNSGDYLYAAELYKECLPALASSNDPLVYNVGLCNYGSSLFYLKRYDESYKILKQALTSIQVIDNDHLEGIVHGKIAEIADKRGHFKEASTSYKKAYQILLITNSPEILTVASGYIKMLNNAKMYDDALTVINTIEKSIDFKKKQELLKS